MVYYSLQLGGFFSTATPSEEKSFGPVWPIFSLPFLSKTCKNLFLNSDMTLSSFNINEKYHSGFYSCHSTETELFKIINDVKSNTDQNKDSVLVLLNCSLHPTTPFF